MTDQPETIAPVYLASIALEPNRWKKDAEKIPSLKVSQWSAAAKDAGFEGWELWEHHYFRTDGAERASLNQAVLPVRIFNTYLRPGIDGDERWQQVVDSIRQLGRQVKGVKFNLGMNELPFEAQVEAAMKWAELLPLRVQMLCECHGGTVLEGLDAAAAAFKIWPRERFGAILHPLGKAADHCERHFDVLGDRIRHLHWQARDAENRWCSIESVPEEFSAALESLRVHGFSGSQSVEFVAGTGGAGETVEGLFESAVKDLRSLTGG